MAAELPRPGVEVVQVFRAVSPTIVTPTLVPCVVGVCKQIVDVLETTSSGSQELNSQALVTLPGFFIASPGTGDPVKYTGLDGLSLVLSIDNGPSVTTVFDDATASGLTPSSVVAQIQAAFLAAGVTAATAETIGDDRFWVRTVGIGEFETIKIVSTTDPSVLTAFGIASNKTFAGVSNYAQYQLKIPQVSFPDPRSNLEQLSIENDTIRVFLALGSGAALQELLRTQSFLRNGGDATPAVLTGDVDITAITYALPAVITGSTDVTSGALYGGGGTLHGETLILTVNGVGPTTLTFNGATNTANQAALLAAIGVAFSAITATVGGSGGTKLVLTDEAIGGASYSSITVSGSSTSLSALGLTATTVNGTAGDLDDAAVTLSIDDATNLVVTFSPPPADENDVLDFFNTALDSDAEASLSTDFLRITTASEGADASIEIVSGTLSSLTTLGLDVGTVTGTSGVAAIDDGNGDALTPLLSFIGEDFTASASAAVLTGTVDVSAGGLYGGGGTLIGQTLTLGDGRVAQTYTFPSLANVAALLVALNAFFGTVADGKLTFTEGGSGGNKLVITHSDLGAESIIRVEGLGVSASTDGAVLLGLIPSVTAYPAVAYGDPFPPASGDELYVDGTFLGKITQVAPGGVVEVLKVDKQLPIEVDQGAKFYIIAKNLVGAQTSLRPSSDLIVDLNGAPLMKHEVLRDTLGNAITGRAGIYLQYIAVREDVTALAQNPGLLRFSDTTAIESALSPISVENPLALGLFFCQLNAPGIEITGLGVDAISADSPYGTVEGFTRAAEFLEGFEVYGIAPLTHDATVAQVFNTHVSVMSDPSNKGERIVLINPSQPTNKIDTLVASGLKGQTTGSGGTQFDTGINNLSALLLNAGVNPVGTIDADLGVFLDIAADDLHYSIANVTGSVVTIRNTFASEDNEDAFYATTLLNTPPLPGQLIDEAFAIRVRGAALVNVDGTPNKSDIAATYQGLGQAYLNRRFWQVVAGSAGATIGGLEQSIEAFYLCAAIVGMIGQQPPQQSFTNFPMTGFTRVGGTNDFFSERQLNVVAAGGNYIVVQDTQGAPLISRMALTTDLTSIETRTDSVTKVVDFTAKFLRRGLKNFIGRFNITQGFLDSLGSVIQGLLDFLVQTGVLLGANLNNIIQDEDAPDTVLVDITIDPPLPCNYLRLTLVV